MATKSGYSAEIVQDIGVALGIEVSTNTPEEYAAYLRADVAKWARVVRAANVQAH